MKRLEMRESTRNATAGIGRILFADTGIVLSFETIHEIACVIDMTTVAAYRRGQEMTPDEAEKAARKTVVASVITSGD